MKTRKTRYHCQRKQSLSPNTGNGLWSVPVEKTGSPPLPPTKSTTKQWSLVSDWNRSASHTWLLLIKCQFNGAGGGDTIRLGERLKPLSSPAWTTHCPFLREGNGNKKPTGQGFCKWNSGLTGQLLQSIRIWFLGPCLRLRRTGFCAVILLQLRMPAVSLYEETCL